MIAKQCDFNYLPSPTLFSRARALFFCKNITESINASLVAYLWVGNSSIFLNKCSWMFNVIDSSLSAFIRWITVKCLPFEARNNEIFKSVVFDYGGLMEVDKNTANQSILTVAKINVKFRGISTLHIQHPLTSTTTSSHPIDPYVHGGRYASDSYSSQITSTNSYFCSTSQGIISSTVNQRSEPSRRFQKHYVRICKRPSGLTNVPLARYFLFSKQKTRSIAAG